MEEISVNMEEGKKKKKALFYSAETGQSVIFYTILLLVILLPIGRIVSDLIGHRTTMFVQSRIVLGFFFVSVVIILIEHINNRIEWKKHKVLYMCVICAFCFSFINSFNAAIPKFAFWGILERGEGLMQMGGYYCAFILGSLLVSEKKRNVIIHTLILLVAIFSIMGVFQYFDICLFGSTYHRMASFPCGNPNHFASLCIMFSGIAMGGYWLFNEESKLFHPHKWVNKGVWLILVVISYIGCITTRSSVVYVGLIMMFFLLLFLELVTKKKTLGRIGIMLALCLLTMLIFNILSQGGVWGEISTSIKEIEEEGSVFGDSVGTHRMKIWKDVIGLLPLYWLQGCGIEHLGFVYIHVYGLLPNWQLPDRAHNEYLHLWITQGIIPLVFYLVFLFCLFIPGILQYIKKSRYKMSDSKMLMIIPFFGYIAQAFFNISVIPVAPYFWLICGFLCMNKKSNDLEVRNESIPEKNIEKI